MLDIHLLQKSSQHYLGIRPNRAAVLQAGQDKGMNPCMADGTPMYQFSQRLWQQVVC